MSEIITAVLTFGITGALAYFLKPFSSRRELVQDVAERYISGNNPQIDDDPAARLGLMQRAGVGLFRNERELKKFIEFVIGRGCAHPFRDSELPDIIPAAKVPLLLRAASEQGVSLSDDLAVYEFITEATSRK